MGKDKSSSKDSSKKEKKEKRSEKDGVKKSKKDKKSKLNGENIAAAVAEVTKEKEESDEEEVVVKAVAVKGDDMDVVVALKPVGALVPFAAPLADEKVAKKVLKGVKKAAKNKTLKRGVKEVVKALRKSPQGAPASIPGIVVLAADISPMDVISHIPVLCEDHNVPYIFVTSRAELGAAGNTKRPTSVVMVSEKISGKKGEKVEVDAEFAEVYKDLLKTVEKEARNIRV
ncbi:hypothetical protein HYALB_00011109 [Hymenoscyphus albidus]|uniref:H/ACA ribonucleoprotein complex subunit 2 n=1 Tax=Hymenoscyphus albidus TaxID=595503 RepID=A0A9N9LVR3_9HELO|nr:hypothetical protein HYALB_00011109 [Hymenoscyphus albidus]